MFTSGSHRFHEDHCLIVTWGSCASCPCERRRAVERLTHGQDARVTSEHYDWWGRKNRMSIGETSRRKIVSPDVLRGSGKERTPPGQKLTTKWPVLHYGSVPKVDPHSQDWSLRVFGKCEK